MIALGVRFDDRVTGKLEAFATHARIVHIDIDPAEIDKNKAAHIPICADVKPALQMLNKMLEQDPIKPEQYAEWRADIEAQKKKFPMRYPDREDVIAPQHAVEVRKPADVTIPVPCPYHAKYVASGLVSPKINYVLVFCTIGLLGC